MYGVLLKWKLKNKINKNNGRVKPPFKINTMKELIEILEQIDIDFYKGFYTVGERYDLIKEINQVLKNQKFI